MTMSCTAWPSFKGEFRLVNACFNCVCVQEHLWYSIFIPLPRLASACGEGCYDGVHMVKDMKVCSSGLNRSEALPPEG